MSEQSLEAIELELAVLIRRVSSITALHHVGMLERSAYLLLNRIQTQGPAGVKLLSEEFQLDISTVSRQCAALEHKGYVQRQPDPADGRAYSLQITEEGARQLAENQQARRARLEEVLADWPSADKQELARLLARFNRSIVDKSAHWQS